MYHTFTAFRGYLLCHCNSFEPHLQHFLVKIKKIKKTLAFWINICYYIIRDCNNIKEVQTHGKV